MITKIGKTWQSFDWSRGYHGQRHEKSDEELFRRGGDDRKHVENKMTRQRKFNELDELRNMVNTYV